MFTRLLRSQRVGSLTFIINNYNMIFTGIDVSKDRLNAACINMQGEVLFETETINNALGFRKILSLAEKYAGGKPFRIGFESTGIYHLKLLKFCLGNNLSAFIINPVLCAQATRLSVRPRKTDRTDAVLISQLTMSGKGREIQEFDLPKGRRTILNTIDKYKEFIQSLKCHRHSSVAEDEAILGYVHNSLKESIDYLENEVKTLKAILKSLDSADTELLCSFSGISSFAAHKIIDRIGEVRRFSNGSKLVAFAGYEPKPIQSGSSINYHGRITKRGSGKLRHVLFQCAFVASVHDPELKEFYTRLRSRGVHHTAAVCAVARKLILRIYAVLKRGTPYIPHKVLTC